MADDCDQIYSSLEEKKRKRIFPNPHLKVNLHVPLATHGSSTPSTAAAEIASYRRSSSLSRKRVVDAVHSYEMFGSDIYGGVGGVAYMHWRYALADGEGRYAGFSHGQNCHHCVEEYFSQMPIVSYSSTISERII
tara:strand:+ start:91 stop:495 length:405 start_codon:yes stop_codon:yes gene_type:complete